uniref:SS18 N-terminal domain-containing protein n=1 Tax=Trichuris muris TaxID=70415 RepID=A0A5S6QK59_TRIMR
MFAARSFGNGMLHLHCGAQHRKSPRRAMSHKPGEQSPPSLRIGVDASVEETNDAALRLLLPGMLHLNSAMIKVIAHLQNESQFEAAYIYQQRLQKNLMLLLKRMRHIAALRTTNNNNS